MTVCSLWNLVYDAGSMRLLIMPSLIGKYRQKMQTKNKPTEQTLTLDSLCISSILIQKLLFENWDTAVKINRQTETAC